MTGMSELDVSSTADIVAPVPDNSFGSMTTSLGPHDDEHADVPRLPTATSDQHTSSAARPNAFAGPRIEEHYFQSARHAQAWGNVRKVLDRLLESPEDVNRHRMRRDVFQRLCQGLEMHGEIFSAMEYCGFSVGEATLEWRNRSESQNNNVAAVGAEISISAVAAAEKESAESETQVAAVPEQRGQVPAAASGTRITSTSTATSDIDRVKDVVREIRRLELQTRAPESITFAEVLEAVKSDVQLPGIVQVDELQEQRLAAGQAAPLPGAGSAPAAKERPKKPWEA